MEEEIECEIPESKKEEKLLDIVDELHQSYNAGNIRDEPTLDRITVKAFEKFPEDFSLKEFKYPNSQKVYCYLLKLRRDKKIWGNNKSLVDKREIKMGESKLEQMSFFGKLPHEEEKRTAGEIMKDVEEVYTRIYIPFIVVDKATVIDKLKNIKSKLEQMGI
jgi:hypothetical protein